MLEPSRKSRQMQSCCNRAAIVFRRSSSRHALELPTATKALCRIEAKNVPGPDFHLLQ